MKSSEEEFLLFVFFVRINYTFKFLKESTDIELINHKNDQMTLIHEMNIQNKC